MLKRLGSGGEAVQNHSLASANAKRVPWFPHHPFFVLLTDWSRWMQHADLVHSGKPEVLVGVHSQAKR